MRHVVAPGAGRVPGVVNLPLDVVLRVSVVELPPGRGFQARDHVVPGGRHEAGPLHLPVLLRQRFRRLVERAARGLEGGRKENVGARVRQAPVHHPLHVRFRLGDRELSPLVVAQLVPQRPRVVLPRPRHLLRPFHLPVALRQGFGRLVERPPPGFEGGGELHVAHEVLRSSQDLPVHVALRVGGGEAAAGPRVKRALGSVVLASSRFIQSAANNLRVVAEGYTVGHCFNTLPLGMGHFF
mmetsp:Transcript_28893/g.58088  ORF Transcript_28893/g.58088 Transcript_28893/m.58088 type:complete len:240 (+) Transcript_28893:432-1151(+)